jgi:hypothetical protein
MDGLCDCEQPDARITHPIALVESLLRDDPALVQHEHARIRQADMARVRRDAVVSVVFLDTLVQKPELSDRVTALIGQQRKRDSVLLGEGSEDLDRVIADREQGNAIGIERGPYALQLDELRPAERSPVGAAVEDDDGLARCARRVEVDHGPALIGQPNLRKSLALVGPDLREVSRRQGHRFSLPLGP